MKFWSLFLLFSLLFIQSTFQQDDGSSCIFAGCECQASDNSEDSQYVSCSGVSDFPKRNNAYSRKQFFELVIEENDDLREIPDERFEGLSFEEIALGNNHIKIIGANAFKGLSGVRSLDLSHNCLGCGQEEKKGSGSLDDTSSEQVQITDLVNPAVFDPLRAQLQELKLEKNRLRHLSLSSLNRLFQNLHALKSLSLEVNGLKNAPNLSHLHNLQSLHIKDNKIVTLNAPKDASSQLILPSKLGTLDLENNMIGTVEAHWFSHLTELRKLSLKKNLISLIAENAFTNLRKLEELDLSENYIKHIPSRCFITLGVLKSLDLSKQTTELESIGDFAFDREVTKREDGVYNQLEVVLDNNKISKISNRAFCASRNSLKSTFISSVSLKGNPLADVNPCVFRQINTEDDSKVKAKALRDRNSLSLPVLSCNCDVTYLSNLFDLSNNECKNERMSSVRMENFYCVTYDDYSKQKQDECKQEAYDCSLGKPAPVVPSKPETPTDDKQNSGPGDKNSQSILSTIKPANTNAARAVVVVSSRAILSSSLLAILFLLFK